MRYLEKIQSIINNLAKFALPMLAGNIFVAITSLINIHLLGKSNPDNFYIFAVFSPIYYLFLAFQESFRGTTLMISTSHSKHFFKKIIFLVAILGVFMASIISFLSHWISIWFHVNTLLSNQFKWFIQEMGWINVLLTLGVVFNAAIVGAGFPRSAFLFTIVTCLLTTFLLIFQLTYLHQGLHSFTTASWIANFVMGTVMVLFLQSRKRFTNKKSRPTQFGNTTLLKLLSNTSLPLFISYLIIFSGFAICNSLLAKYGVAVVAGYGIACRLQMLLILPAIGIGSALAILVNNKITENKVLITVVGIGITIALYGFLSVAIHYYNNQLIQILVSAETIREAAIDYFQQVSFSYIFLGPIIAFVTLLEQIGYALQVMLFNLCYFACIGLAGYFFLEKQTSYNYFFHIISYANYASFILILIFFKRFNFKPIS